MVIDRSKIVEKCARTEKNINQKHYQMMICTCQYLFDQFKMITKNTWISITLKVKYMFVCFQI